MNIIGGAPSQITVFAEPLAECCRQILVALNCDTEHALLLADSLVDANLRAIDSHGIQMLPQYVSQIRAGGIDPHTDGRQILRSGSCLLYDGQHGIGQVIADRCATFAAQIASEHGISIVVARRSNHFGAASYWARRIVKAGCIGIVMSNASPAVAPWQGEKPVFGTNPFCIGVPGEPGREWMLDMSTTTVALGKLAHASNLMMESIPLAWGFLDESGKPTSSTSAAQNGTPTPIGGYKGSGLAMMVELLSSVLSGGLIATEVPTLRTGSEPLSVSHTFLAIDPARFMPANRYAERVTHLIEMVKAASPAGGYGEILVAGEPEERAYRERKCNGIPVPLKLWGLIEEIASSLDLSPPSIGRPE